MIELRLIIPEIWLDLNYFEYEFKFIFNLLNYRRFKINQNLCLFFDLMKKLL